VFKDRGSGLRQGEIMGNWRGDNMWRLFATGFVIGLSVLAAGTISGARRQRRDKQAENYRAEVADATPVEEGVMTPAQRVHGALYTSRNYPERMSTLIGGETIAELARRSKENVLGIDALPGMGPLREQETPEHFFASLARESDAVVRGRAVKKTSQITVDGYFLFTDYELRVSEVFKDNPLAPILAGSTITVTRPGGKIALHGVVIRVTDHYFYPLPMNGNEVVLFLKFVPVTGAYQPAGDSHSFEMLDSSVRALNGDGVPTDLTSLQTILKAIRTTAN